MENLRRASPMERAAYFGAARIRILIQEKVIQIGN
jgi:hypothetical protein